MDNVVRPLNVLFLAGMMAFMFFTATPLWANPPATVNVHGTLLDSADTPLSGGRAYVLRFFDAATLGTQLGGDLVGIVVVSPEGLFNLPVTLPPEALAAAEVWYELGIDTDMPEDGIAEDDLFPDRIRVHSVPFAMEADSVIQVDADRVGTGTVDNTELGHLDGVTEPVQPALDAKADATDLTNHTGDNTNPHEVTAAQVGLGNVDNTADADKPVSTATEAALNTKADAAALANHLGDNANPHLVTAAQVGLGNVDNTADEDKPVSTAMGTALTEKLDRASETYVVVDVGANAAENGMNLRDAYTAAKALTPYSLPLSAGNRAVVLVPPGYYNLDGASLSLDTDFVDLVGISTARDDQCIFNNAIVLSQTASDVRIENLVFHYTGDSVSAYAYSPNATWDDGTPHTGSPPATRIRNCAFLANARSMRVQREYAGMYEDCIAVGYQAFGGWQGIASGTFINCTGGEYTFGGYNGIASGTFIRCRGGDRAFGGNEGTASGIFTDCIGGERSFGGTAGTASGVFTRCIGDDQAFGGGGGTASGDFMDCTGGDYAFGSSGEASGSFINCIGGDYAFGSTGEAGGSFTDCVGGNFAFGGNGDANGIFTNCVGGNNAFGGYVTGSTTGGSFYGCRMTGPTYDSVFTGRMENCRWDNGFTCGAAARIYRSTILGNVDLNNTTAGIAHSAVKGGIKNAGSASFNMGNLEDTEVN